jgi:aryl-alcohol dehydrogenase-like predicted oxidoreductase
LQVPFHVINPSAGHCLPEDCGVTDYGQILTDCQQQNMGVFAIRVFAAGALLGRLPSAHTRVTPFFPLELYQSDLRRANQLVQHLPAGMTLKELAVRYVLSQKEICSAIIGFGSPEQVDEVVDIAAQGPHDEATLAAIAAALELVYRATPQDDRSTHRS